MGAQRAVRREGKEGNRWVNVRPTGEELAAWFKANVDIDEHLKDEDYIGGLTLIPGNEKTKEIVGWDDGNSPKMSDVWDLVFTPYIRVETRVKYFFDLMNAYEDRVGVVEPIPLIEQDPKLPKGFFVRTVATSETESVRMICCSMKASVFKAGTMRMEKRVVDKRTGEEAFVRVGELLQDSPPATKVVPLLFNSGSVDINAVMKAETGAVGRALGMAGCLVIPGTGLATAEDIQELNAGGGAAGGNVLADEAVAAELPPGAGAPAEPDEQLREQVVAAMGRMKEPRVVEFKKWAADRGFGALSEVTSPALRGMLRKAEKIAKESEAADASRENPAPEQE